MYTVGISDSTIQSYQESEEKKTTMGKDDFLKLLVTQMRYQDPLNPMDNTEYAAQLAQFSSLEQLQNLNENAGNQLLVGQSLNNSFLTSLLGKEVKAYGDGITLGEDDVNIDYNISYDATVKIKIYDENGQLVKTIDAGKQNGGDNTFAWDGTSNSGSDLPEGNYTFAVEATDDSGATVSSQGYTAGQVSGILYDNGSPYLKVNGQIISLGNVISFGA